MESCKRKISWFWVVSTTAVFFGLGVTSAQAQMGDPVPGLDLSLQSIPGGVIATTTTDKDGRFNFDDLCPGEYVLRIVPPQFQAKAENYNSSRSNTSTSIDDGVEGHDVSIELQMDKRLMSAEYEDITILISSGHLGRVTGQITLQPVATEEVLQRRPPRIPPSS